MTDAEGIKQEIKNLHSVSNPEENTEIIKYYIGKLKKSEQNIINKINVDYKDSKFFDFEKAKRMTNGMLFEGIEDIVELYK